MYSIVPIIFPHYDFLIDSYISKQKKNRLLVNRQTDKHIDGQTDRQKKIDTLNKQKQERSTDRKSLKENNTYDGEIDYQQYEDK